MVSWCHDSTRSLVDFIESQMPIVSKKDELNGRVWPNKRKLMLLRDLGYDPKNTNPSVLLELRLRQPKNITSSKSL